LDLLDHFLFWASLVPLVLLGPCKFVPTAIVTTQAACNLHQIFTCQEPRAKRCFAHFGCIRLRFGQGCGQTLFDSVGVTPAVPADSNAAMTLKRPKEASCVKLSANALWLPLSENANQILLTPDFV